MSSQKTRNPVWPIADTIHTLNNAQCPVNLLFQPFKNIFNLHKPTTQTFALHLRYYYFYCFYAVWVSAFCCFLTSNTTVHQSNIFSIRSRIISLRNSKERQLLMDQEKTDQTLHTNVRTLGQLRVRLYVYKKFPAFMLRCHENKAYA